MLLVANHLELYTEMIVSGNLAIFYYIYIVESIKEVVSTYNNKLPIMLVHAVMLHASLFIVHEE